MVKPYKLKREKDAWILLWNASLWIHSACRAAWRFCCEIKRMGSFRWSFSVALMLQTRSYTPQSRVDNHFFTNGDSFHVSVCWIRIFLLLTRGSIFFSLRTVVGAEEAAELKVKQWFFPSPCKRKHTVLILVFKYWAVCRALCPLSGSTFVTCDIEAIAQLLEHKNCLAWICVTTHVLGNSNLEVCKNIFVPRLTSNSLISWLFQNLADYYFS